MDPSRCPLFRGILPEEITALLQCVSARDRTFRKGNCRCRERRTDPC